LIETDVPQVYQFKLTLATIKPAIWRRIQVPGTYTFWDLHIAIQDAMGWMDAHLHQFDVINPLTGEEEEIGIPDTEWGNNSLPGWKVPISAYFSLKNRSTFYVYDFGDNWEHRVKLEKLLPEDSSQTYPVCMAGERACPPEDCGGVWGYGNLLKTLKKPKNEETKRTMKWLGGSFDPEAFTLEDVRFDDPKQRWKKAFGGSASVKVRK
jgi:Plasmid pRiA4b ORF-3-like protein